MTNRPDQNNPQTGGQTPYQPPQGQYQAPWQPQGQYQAPQQPQGQYQVPQQPQGQYQAPQPPQGQYQVPQPPQGQYQQYPAAPGFRQKPQRPGWVIPLIVVAAVAVILCAVLIGMLLGRGNTYGPDTRSEPEASSEISSKEAPTPAPAAEPDADDLLGDGGFDDGISDSYGLYLDYGDAELSWENGELAVHINGWGIEPNSVQVYRQDFELQAGSAYRLEFDVRSTVAREMEYSIQENGGDWLVLSQEETEIGETVKHVQMDFTPDRTVSGQISLNLGVVNSAPDAFEEHWVYLDNVRLICTGKGAAGHHTEENHFGQSAETGWSVGDCVEDVIDKIEDQAQFVKNYDFEPLGCVDDFDGDGNQDFLASYETEAKNGTRCVSYCVYTFREDGPQLVADGVLYQAVGGNGGSVGISKGKDGSAYLTRFTKEADGSSVHNYYEYLPFWDLGVTEDNLYCMESQWDIITPEQGNYFLGGRKVEKEAFEVARGNYQECYSLNLVIGHGNGEGNGVDFETLKQWYDD